MLSATTKDGCRTQTRYALALSNKGINLVSVKYRKLAIWVAYRTWGGKDRRYGR